MRQNTKTKQTKITLQKFKFFLATNMAHSIAAEKVYMKFHSRTHSAAKSYFFGRKYFAVSSTEKSNFFIIVAVTKNVVL